MLRSSERFCERDEAHRTCVLVQVSLTLFQVGFDTPIHPAISCLETLRGKNAAQSDRLILRINFHK
jgi:hypothetical protein